MTAGRKVSVILRGQAKEEFEKPYFFFPFSWRSTIRFACL